MGLPERARDRYFVINGVGLLESAVSARVSHLPRVAAGAMVLSLVASLTVGAPAALAATGDSEPHTGNGCGSQSLTLEA